MKKLGKMEKRWNEKFAVIAAGSVSLEALAERLVLYRRQGSHLMIVKRFLFR